MFFLRQISTLCDIQVHRMISNAPIFEYVYKNLFTWSFCPTISIPNCKWEGWRIVLYMYGWSGTKSGASTSPLVRHKIHIHTVIIATSINTRNRARPQTEKSSPFGLLLRPPPPRARAAPPPLSLSTPLITGRHFYPPNPRSLIHRNQSRINNLNNSTKLWPKTHRIHSLKP